MTSDSRHQKTAPTINSAHFPAKTRSKRKIKLPTEVKSQPVMSLLQPGEKLPVEIMFTQSLVDIVWQVGFLYCHLKSFGVTGSLFCSFYSTVILNVIQIWNALIGLFLYSFFTRT